MLPVPRLFLPVNSSRQLQRISHSFHCQLQEVQRKLLSRKIGIENHDVFKISFGSPVCALCGWCLLSQKASYKRQLWRWSITFLLKRWIGNFLNWMKDCHFSDFRGKCFYFPHNLATILFYCVVIWSVELIVECLNFWYSNGISSNTISLIEM